MSETYEIRQWVGKDRTYNLRQYPHPGKFEGGYVVDEYVWEVSLSGADAELGDQETFGYYSLLRQGFTIFQDHDPFLESLTEDERDFLTSLAGVIVYADSQGFAYFTYYEDKEELDRDWDQVESEWQKWCDQEENSDE